MKTDWTIIGFVWGFALLIGLIIVVAFLDARAFADECIRAGGYVADAGTCVKP